MRECGGAEYSHYFYHTNKVADPARSRYRGNSELASGEIVAGGGLVEPGLLLVLARAGLLAVDPIEGVAD